MGLGAEETAGLDDLSDVVLLCVGNGNMRKTARLCNDAGLPVPEPLVSSMAELTFGPTPSGVGLALRF